MSRYSDKEKIVQSSKGGETWELLSWDTTEESFRPLGGSELQRVVEFNERAGNERKHHSLASNEFLAQMYLIEEEYEELLSAWREDNLKEVFDALGDLIVVVSGAIHRLGYNPDDVLKIVNDSNMSKFVDPDNKEEVEASVRKYDEDDRYSDVYVDERGAVWGTVVGTGAKKTLKGIYYKEPQWQELDPELK